MLKRICAATLILGTVAQAEPPLSCEGIDPDWYLTLAGTTATLDYLRKNTFDIPQTNAAEGRDWPRAYTLIAEFDTAIVLVNEATCDLDGRPWPLTANILTQRGQTPILLTGCCTVAE